MLDFDLGLHRVRPRDLMRERTGVIRLLKGYKGGELRASWAGNLDILHWVISATIGKNAPDAQIKEEGKGSGNSRS